MNKSPAPAPSGKEQDRNLDHLHQSFRTPFEKWLAEARSKGFKILVVETFRTAARQQYLYSLGRTVKSYIQRPGCGDLGCTVTDTLDSAHEYGVAADVVRLDANGNADWSQGAYNTLYAAVPPTKYGLELLSWERPHIQIKGGQATAKKMGLKANVIVGSRWPV